MQWYRLAQQMKLCGNIKLVPGRLPVGTGPASGPPLMFNNAWSFHRVIGLWRCFVPQVGGGWPRKIARSQLQASEKSRSWCICKQGAIFGNLLAGHQRRDSVFENRVKKPDAVCEENEISKKRNQREFYECSVYHQVSVCRRGENRFLRKVTSLQESFLLLSGAERLQTKPKLFSKLLSGLQQNTK